ncbi:unnamed protein product [Schistosoma bovis]|nr:unnamed protein product [Schistosoma bovis]
MMSSLCATVWPKPISLIPCLSWTSASCVFLEGILSNTVDWPVLTKQYYSDSVYSDVIRPRIQPPIPEFYRTTDETFNDNLGDNLQYSTISVNSLHSKHSNPVNVAPLATFSKQLDSRLHPIKRNPLKSSYSSFQVRDLLSQFINISNSTSQLSSSHSNTHKFTIAQKFLPSFIYTGLPNSLSTFNFNTVFRYQWNSYRWHKEISLLPRVSLPSVSFPRTDLSPDPEVRQFLRDLLDYFTHLGNFSPVIDSRLVLSVAAEYDAYVPRGSVCSLKKVYPNGEIRFLPQSGHVGAYVKNSLWTNDFRKAISDCLNQQVHLYHHEPGPFGRMNTSRKNIQLIKRLECRLFYCFQLKFVFYLSMYVVLLKSAGDNATSIGDDPYVQILKNSGFSVDLLETLDFEYNISNLAEYKNWRNNHSCIIFSSPRSVIACVKAGLTGNENDLCFVVGPSTELQAKKAGFSPKGADSGDAEKLASFILKHFASSNL